MSDPTIPANPPAPSSDPCPPVPDGRERRRVPRETTDAPPHVAEQKTEPEPIAPIAPHMAESEPVKEAQIVTVRSSRGKTTMMIERTPGKAMHATVIAETPDPNAPSAEKPPEPENPHPQRHNRRHRRHRRRRSAR